MYSPAKGKVEEKERKSDNREKHGLLKSGDVWISNLDQLVGSLSPPPSFSSFFFLSTISCFEFPVSRRNNEFRKMYKLARMDFTSILYSQICLIFLKTQEYKYQFLSRPREINSLPRFS